MQVNQTSFAAKRKVESKTNKSSTIQDKMTAFGVQAQYANSALLSVSGRHVKDPSRRCSQLARMTDDTGSVLGRPNMGIMYSGAVEYG